MSVVFISITNSRNDIGCNMLDMNIYINACLENVSWSLESFVYNNRLSKFNQCTIQLVKIVIRIFVVFRFLLILSGYFASLFINYRFYIGVHHESPCNVSYKGTDGRRSPWMTQWVKRLTLIDFTFWPLLYLVFHWSQDSRGSTDTLIF